MVSYSRLKPNHCWTGLFSRTHPEAVSQNSSLMKEAATHPDTQDIAAATTSSSAVPWQVRKQDSELSHNFLLIQKMPMQSAGTREMRGQEWKAFILVLPESFQGRNFWPFRAPYSWKPDSERCWWLLCTEFDVWKGQFVRGQKGS